MQTALCFIYMIWHSNCQLIPLMLCILTVYLLLHIDCVLILNYKRDGGGQRFTHTFVWLMGMWADLFWLIC